MDNRVNKELLEELRRRSRERIEEEERFLQQIDEEGAFAPRKSLMRTPPETEDAPPETVSGYSKRPLSSPEDPPEACRRRLERVQAIEIVHEQAGTLSHRPSVRMDAPPLGGLQDPRHQEESTDDDDNTDDLSRMSKVAMLTAVHEAVKGIMSVSTATNKLNMADKAAIGGYGHQVLAVVAALELKLADAEKELIKSQLANSKLQLQLAAQAHQVAEEPRAPQSLASLKPDYARALKTGKTVPPIAIPSSTGTSVAFYPSEKESFKTAEETKTELKKTVNPKSLGIQVRQVRKVGNAGIVVTTSTREDAEKLKVAAPKTLRAADLTRRQPLVALRNIDAETKEEDIVHAIEEQAARRGLEDWTSTKITQELRVAFKKGRLNSRTATYVLQCSPNLRCFLLDEEAIYIGWQVADVTDYVAVTCCNRCQQYGHPEKYCRATEDTCSKCGNTGHKSSRCESAFSCCATCKKFGRKGYETHKTMARECPARQFAEARSVEVTKYV